MTGTLGNDYRGIIEQKYEGTSSDENLNQILGEMDAIFSFFNGNSRKSITRLLTKHAELIASFSAEDKNKLVQRMTMGNHYTEADATSLIFQRE